jgi:hypothetical protein
MPMSSKMALPSMTHASLSSPKESQEHEMNRTSSEWQEWLELAEIQTPRMTPLQMAK